MQRIALAGAVLGAALVGCGEKEATTGGPAPTPAPATAADPAPATAPAAPRLVAGATPEDIMSPATFLDAPEAFDGRIGIEGAVFNVDADGSRLLVCDAAEAG